MSENIETAKPSTKIIDMRPYGVMPCVLRVVGDSGACLTCGYCYDTEYADFPSDCPMGRIDGKATSAAEVIEKEKPNNWLEFWDGTKYLVYGIILIAILTWGK